MKFGLITLLFTLSLSLKAQFPGTFTQAIPVDFSYDQVNRSGNPLTINYDESDELIYGLNYQRKLFPVHRGYDTIPGQHIVYALYTMDSLIKTDNSYTIPFYDAPGIMLDSLEMVLGHVNHSGGNDTLIITLLKLDAAHFPNDTIELVDTIVLSTPLSPGNVLTNTVNYRWYPSYWMNDQPFGIKLEFTGSLQDTLALMGGYGIWPAPNACTNSSWDKSRKSFFYANSYVYWSDFNLILPTAAGGDLFYNCDTIPTKDTADSESYIQNWAITSYISAPEIGLSDEDQFYLTIYPNPASNIVYFKNVDMIDRVMVYNAAGELVLTGLGVNKLEITGLTNGIYIFALQHENRTFYKKLVVQR